jgi:hypothetical protein
MALIDKLSALADSIRAKTGSTEKLTLEQMATAIKDIETTPETIVLVDDNGNELTAILTDEVVEITATPNDVRAGTTAVMSTGLGEGTKQIPSYHTAEGYRIITNGTLLHIPHNDYDYEKLQAVICSFNTSFANSVAATKVALENNVYDVNSTTPISAIVKDSENIRVDFGITNDTGKMCVIRYFMYKEIY